MHLLKQGFDCKNIEISFSQNVLGFNSKLADFQFLQSCENNQLSPESTELYIQLARKVNHAPFVSDFSGCPLASL